MLPLVDRAYQLRYFTRMLITICAFAVLSSLLATAILWKNMYRPELDQQLHIASGLIGMAMVLLIELLIAVPVVYFLAIRQSNQIVGPLKRITHAIEAIGQGDFSQRLVLRQGDVLEDMATSINQMAEQLRKRYSHSPPS